MTLGALSAGDTIILDPVTGLSQQTLSTVSTVDWSNPSATVVPGDTLPNGDTYAGPITNVAQIQADLGLGMPSPSQAGSVGATPYLMLGAVVLGLLLIGGRR